MISTALRLAAIATVATAAIACGSSAATPSAGTASAATATIRLDGSSTVFPISEAIAEEFQKTNPNVRVTVGISGTGGGFQKFCRAETDISDASRPIKPAEVDACQKAGVEYIELPVAYDGLAVVVNPKNTWAVSMTVAELKALWAPEAQGVVTKWSQIRKGWPDREIHLFGAGVDSGTYDYFTEAIVGKEGASRGDFTSSEDDNVIVQGVAGDEGALGFLPLAYVEQNLSALKLVPVDDGKTENGNGPVTPTADTVRNGTYQPLSRPLFIYVAKAASSRPEVQTLVDRFLDSAELVREVGYVELTPEIYGLVKGHFADRKLGSAFASEGSQVGVTIEALLAKER